MPDENMQLGRRLRFAFISDDYYGHANPLMGAARKLVGQGHSVCFFGPGEIKSHVSSKGFDYVALPFLLPRVFPRSTMESEGRRRAADGRSKVSDRAQEILAGIRHLADIYPADLAVFDPFMLCHLPAFIHSGIRSVSVSISPLLVQDAANPPYTTSIVPHKERLWSAKARAAWLWEHVKYARYRAYCIQKEWRFGWSNQSLLRELARLTGFPLRRELSTRPMALDLRFHSTPELVLHAREFEFPCERPLSGSGAYIGPCIDSLDAAPTTDRIPKGNGPLIYCHLGTVRSQQTSMALDGYRTLLQLLRSEPEWRAILVTASPEISAAISNEASALGERALLYTWTSPVSQLPHADVAITHAGDASVKEAIYAGVPMLALPRHHDQPGVAARISYHGLGLKADPGINADAMRAKIHALLNDRKFAERVSAMRANFLRYEREKICERTLINAAHGVMPCFQDQVRRQAGVAG